MWVADDVIGEVGEGPCVLFGVTYGDGKPQIKKTARKIVQLRVLRGADGDDDARRSAEEAETPVFPASQFTLYVDVRKGRSPGWSHAAPGDVAESVVVAVTGGLCEAYGLHTEAGESGAMTDVELVNGDPFTLLIEA